MLAGDIPANQTIYIKNLNEKVKNEVVEDLFRRQQPLPSLDAIYFIQPTKENYEGRCGLPSSFDSNYCYALGYAAGALLHSGKTGLISSKFLGDTGLPYLVTLNPPHTPEHTLLKWETGHPVPSVAASKASTQLDQIQGKRGIWFCGAYQGYGFHEDGLKAGIVAGQSLLRKSCTLLKNPTHMVPSWTEAGARILVTRFLNGFIATGCLMRFGY